MLTGGDEVARRLRALASQVPGRALALTEEVAEKVLEQAREAAPVDTGALRASAFLDRGSGGGIEIGFSAPHALTVHERVDVAHQTGEAKFLERALFAAEGELARQVAQSLEQP